MRHYCLIIIHLYSVNISLEIVGLPPPPNNPIHWGHHGIRVKAQKGPEKSPPVVSLRLCDALCLQPTVTRTARILRNNTQSEIDRETEVGDLKATQ